MAINTLDDLVAATAGSKDLRLLKASSTAVAGRLMSLWRVAGQPEVGAIPTAAAVCTSATTGASNFTNPGAGKTLYVVNVGSVFNSVAATTTILDRLVACGGLSGIVATAQTVNTPALTRRTDGKRNRIFLEWYTATGATGVNVTASYTNQDGTSGKTTGTLALPATVTAGSMLELTLASDDTGVKSVESVTLSATTGTAGNFGVTIAAVLASVPSPLANLGYNFDAQALGLPVVENDACLQYAVTSTTTATGIAQAVVRLGFA